MGSRSPNVHIFWDNSNIFISAQQVALQKEPQDFTKNVRIHFENLFQLAVANRPFARGIAVGSITQDQRPLWDKLKASTGIEIELYERGRISGTEQGLDQCLQTHMLRALVDEAIPQVAVLLTGDGKGYEDGVGFHADLERMKKKGWAIEVLAWNSTCNSNLKSWARKVGVFVELDHYYNSIVFRNGSRQPSALNLIHRQTATPELDASARQFALLCDLEAENKALRKLANIDKYNRKLMKRRQAKK